MASPQQVVYELSLNDLLSAQLETTKTTVVRFEETIKDTARTTTDLKVKASEVSVELAKLGTDGSKELDAVNTKAIQLEKSLHATHETTQTMTRSYSVITTETAKAGSAISAHMDDVRKKINEHEEAVKKAKEEAREYGRKASEALRDYVDDAREKYVNLKEAQDKIKEGLEDTHGAAGLTFKELKDNAESLSGQFKDSQTDITGMQAQLLQFPLVGKKIFGDTEKAVLEMSTKMHTSLNDTSKLVGEALQDPVKGLDALMEADKNFSGEQGKLAKTLAETGRAGDAQKVILMELQKNYGGAAKEAANTDPMLRYKKSMEDVKVSIGSVADYLNQNFMPAINMVTGLYNTASTAGRLLGYAQEFLNGAMEANPIGTVIAAISVLVGVVIYAWNHFNWFKGGILGVWYAMQALVDYVSTVVTGVLQGIGSMIEGIFTFDGDKIKEGFNKATGAFEEGAKNVAAAFKKGWDEGHAGETKTDLPTMDTTPVAAPTAGTAGQGKGDNPGETQTTDNAAGGHIKGHKGHQGHTGHQGHADDKGHANNPSKVSGQKEKVLAINIKIDSLVKSFTVQTTNMQEGASQLKDLIVRTLLGAVNDSQMMAGQ